MHCAASNGGKVERVHLPRVCAFPGEPANGASDAGSIISTFNITGVAAAYARLSKDPARQVSTVSHDECRRGQARECTRCFAGVWKAEGFCHLCAVVVWLDGRL